MTVNPYGRSTIYGHPLDNATIQACHDMESILDFTLTIYQGIGGVPQSAGTHLLGRAVDLAPARADEKLKVAKDLGFIGWHRPFDWDGANGIEHIHLILVLINRANRKGLADLGYRQIGMYDAGRNGLVSNLVDGSYRATPKRAYAWPPKPVKAPPVVNDVTRARDEIVHSMHKIDKACMFLGRTPNTRKAAHSQVSELQAEKKKLAAILDAMPKR